MPEPEPSPRWWPRWRSARARRAVVAAVLLLGWAVVALPVGVLTFERSSRTTVLYLPAEALDELHAPIEAMLADIRPFLAGTVPALTLRVGRGASLAQNPADGRPFGQHRCSLIAGTVLANRGMAHSKVVDQVRETFRRAGVDPQRPYRALGSDWQWGRQPRSGRATRGTVAA